MFPFLRKVPLFEDLPEGDLARLCEMIAEVRLQPGEVLFEEGARGDRAYVIKEGELEILKASAGRDVLLAVRGPGEVIGEMSLLEEAPRSATVRARLESLLLAISQEEFEKLLSTSPSAVRAMLHTVTARLHSTSAMLRQSEKMAQLGTLSAGLAHELNNPAAAVQRAAQQLREAEHKLQETHLAIGRMNLAASQLENLVERGRQVREKAREPDDLDPFVRSEREDDLEEWLEEIGVDDPWDLAHLLVGAGYKPEDLPELAEVFTEEQLPSVATWLGELYAMSSLLEEIHTGAVRISDIVKALKSYVYLDQAPVQAVDLHEGLDNTLVLLRHKLKDGIAIRREYDAELPKIQAYGSELNQVWTNLIDNAADAMGGKGELVLRTRQEGDWIVVEVEDNGPGIPEEQQGRIFDAFFTTKPPGQGTGLGLDITYNIVVNRHKGNIKVYSRPGKTVFRVRLPINFDEVGRGTSAISGISRLPDEKVREILASAKTIAVVGISDRPDAPAYSVPAYLQEHGYRIIPVNPHLETVLGEKAYPNLRSVPAPVDVVEIFRPSNQVPEIVDQAIQIGARVIWMQEGIVNEQAASVAAEAGLDVVMDSCMRTTHKRLLGS